MILLGLAIVPVSVMTLFSMPLDLSGAVERAALLSAMVNMPEGSIALLESHFRGQVDDSYYEGSDSEVAPYMNPWPEQENPDVASSSSESAAASSQAAPASPAVKRPPVTPPSPAKENSHVIPEKYRGTILQENMSGTADNLLQYGEGQLRNYTEVADSEIVKIMEQGMNIHLEDTAEPQVLIFHTHATESYEPYDSETFDLRNTWRTTDNNKNMVAVGNALEKELRDAGIGVIHDTTAHDHPSYTGAYDRSAVTIKSYLEKYPTIKVALDVHRDAIQRADDLIVKPVVEIDGKKAAQLMIITGSDDGTMNVPKWRENLRFASSLQDAIEQNYPHLTRPIFFCYRKYNMDLTTGSILLEVGANGNTLDESIYSAQLIGKSLAKLLNDNRAATAAAATPEPVAESVPSAAEETKSQPDTEAEPAQDDTPAESAPEGT